MNADLPPLKRNNEDNIIPDDSEPDEAPRGI
jgi:hypothetical protein